MLFCLLTNKEYAIIKYMIMVIIDGFYGGVCVGVEDGCCHCGATYRNKQ